MKKLESFYTLKQNVISYFGLYIFDLIFALKFVPDMVLESEILLYVCLSLSTLAIAMYVITKALINDICSCPRVNRPLFTNQLADYSLSWSTWGLLCSILFQYFFQTEYVHVSMLPPRVWATEMWSLQVCASERCLAQRLHRYCELFMNTKPFQCVCVCFNVKNMSRLIVYTQSPPLHTQQYTVCKYVCWSYNRVSGSSWYLHLKVNLNQFPCPVGDACLNDFWLIQRVQTPFNLPSGAWI